MKKKFVNKREGKGENKTIVQGNVTNNFILGPVNNSQIGNEKREREGNHQNEKGESPSIGKRLFTRINNVLSFFANVITTIPVIKKGLLFVLLAISATTIYLGNLFGMISGEKGSKNNEIMNSEDESDISNIGISEDIAVKGGESNASDVDNVKGETNTDEIASKNGIKNQVDSLEIKTKKLKQKNVSKIERIKKDEKCSIVIVDPNWKPPNKEYEEVLSRVFYCGHEKSEIRKLLNEDYIKWNTPKADCFYFGEFKERLDRLTEDANALIETKKDAMSEVYLDDWTNRGPRDTEFIENAEALEELGNEEYMGRSGSYKLFFDAANRYLDVAADYRIQTENETAITYLYAKSIENATRALSYVNEDDNKWSETYEFLFQRYHDVADEGTDVKVNIRARADIICDLLKEWRNNRVAK